LFLSLKIWLKKKKKKKKRVAGLEKVGEWGNRLTDEKEGIEYVHPMLLEGVLVASGVRAGC